MAGAINDAINLLAGPFCTTAECDQSLLHDSHRARLLQMVAFVISLTFVIKAARCDSAGPALAKATCLAACTELLTYVTYARKADDPASSADETYFTYWTSSGLCPVPACDQAQLQHDVDTSEQSRWTQAAVYSIMVFVATAAWLNMWLNVRPIEAAPVQDAPESAPAPDYVTGATVPTDEQSVVSSAYKQAAEAASTPAKGETAVSDKFAADRDAARAAAAETEAMKVELLERCAAAKAEAIKAEERVVQDEVAITTLRDEVKAADAERDAAAVTERAEAEAPPTKPAKKLVDETSVPLDGTSDGAELGELSLIM
jgi:hypothetical protein